MDLWTLSDYYFNRDFLSLAGDVVVVMITLFAVFFIACVLLRRAIVAWRSHRYLKLQLRKIELEMRRSHNEKIDRVYIN